MDHELATFNMPCAASKASSRGLRWLEGRYTRLHKSWGLEYLLSGDWLLHTTFALKTLLWHIVQKQEKQWFGNFAYLSLMTNLTSVKSVTTPPIDMRCWSWCWCWLLMIIMMITILMLTMMKMASGPHLLTHPTPRREVAGSLKDFLLRPHPLPAAYLNYPKLHLSQFWNYLAAFIFLDSLQKYVKLLSHFWVADVPNAIVRQATAEQMGQSNC